MVHQMTRREVNAALPAFAVASAMTTCADASPSDDSEYLALYRELVDANEAWRTYADGPSTGWNDATFDRLSDRFSALLDRFDQMSPVTMEGLAAMIHVQWIDDGPTSKRGSEAWHEEVESPELMRVVRLWRAASGQDGLPRRLV